MYSGITQGLFTVTSVDQQPGLTHYSVALNAAMIAGLSVGASVAIDGACQTVVDLEHDTASFQAIAETLQRSTLSDLYVNRKVSVETSLRYGDVIGGHEMAGHVIGTAKIINILSSDNNLMMTLHCPKAWLNCIFSKGFIGVDGSSLTVGQVDKTHDTFTIYLIPATLQLTNFSQKRSGDRVNIELDFKTQAIVATVERILREQNIIAS